jgi:hypothetical protein
MKDSMASAEPTQPLSLMLLVIVDWLLMSAAECTASIEETEAAPTGDVVSLLLVLLLLLRPRDGDDEKDAGRLLFMRDKRGWTAGASNGSSLTTVVEPSVSTAATAGPTLE